MHIQKKVQEYQVKNQLKQIKIMETRKLALYYGVNQEVIGVRECLHDWKEEDVITTDGAKTEIYAVFDSTPKNMMVIATLFKVLNTNTAMGCLRNFNPAPTDEDEVYDNEELLDFNDFLDIMAVLVCTQWTMKKREWADYEKRLDLMEDMVELIA